VMLSCSWGISRASSANNVKDSHTNYGAVFKLMSNIAPIFMSPLESLASSLVQTANISNASLILVLTRGGTTTRLVAKYRPTILVITTMVPKLKTDDNFNWTCNNECPSRHNMIVSGLILILLAATAKASDTEST
jgi:pyruvate kinase